MRTITTITEDNLSCFQGILPIRESVSHEIMRLGVIEEGAPAAACELLLRDNFCEIESFYVVEKYRRKGIGSELLKTVIRLSQDSSLYGIRADYEKDLGFTEFFEKTGFFVVDGSPVYEVPRQALINNKWVRDALTAKEDPAITSLRTALAKEKNSLFLLLDQSGFDRDAASMDEVDEDLSLVYRGKKGAAEAVVLAVKNGDDVFVTLLVSASKDPRVVVNTLARMVASTFHWEKMPDNFRFFSEGKSILPFLEKLVGKDSIKSSVMTECAVYGLDNGAAAAVEELFAVEI